MDLKITKKNMFDLKILQVVIYLLLMNRKAASIILLAKFYKQEAGPLLLNLQVLKVKISHHSSNLRIIYRISIISWREILRI